MNNLCESLAESCTESNEFFVERSSEPIECNEVVIMTEETMLTTATREKAYPSYLNQKISMSVNSTEISMINVNLKHISKGQRTETLSENQNTNRN